MYWYEIAPPRKSLLDSRWRRAQWVRVLVRVFIISDHRRFTRRSPACCPRPTITQLYRIMVGLNASILQFSVSSRYLSVGSCINLNSRITGATKYTIDKLQRVLNAFCLRYTRKFDRRLSHLLHSDLHWLDIPQRVQCKLGLQCTAVCNTRVPSTWWTAVHSSLMSPVVDTCVLLVVSSCSCRVTVSARLVVGPSLLPVRWPGSCFLTTSGIRHEAPPVSVLRWKLHYSRTSVLDALEALRQCAV